MKTLKVGDEIILNQDITFRYVPSNRKRTIKNGTCGKIKGVIDKPGINIGYIVQFPNVPGRIVLTKDEFVA
jgi:hypothetical protein